MKKRFLVWLGFAAIAACGGAENGMPSDPKPVIVPPNAVFELRAGGRTVGVGGHLIIAVPRGEMASVTFDASGSTAPGSTLTSYAWRINGASAGATARLTVPMAPNGAAYQVELQVTNAAGQTASAGGTIAINEILPPPTITSVTPSALVVSATPQVIVISGTEFASSGLLIITTPDDPAEIAAPLSQFSVTPTTITAAFGLTKPGTYSVQVMSAAGLRSNKVSVVVSVAPLPPPRIASLTPTTLPARRQMQSITLNGSGFRSGLTASIIAPNGAATTLSDAQIVVSDTTSVRLLIDLNGIVGQWSVEVRNPDGQTSNRMPLIATDATPAIVSVSPSPVSASAAAQTITISGANFDATASVTLRDLGTGQAFANHAIASRTATQISISHVFGVPGNWTAQVINTDGVASAAVQFAVVSAPAANPPMIIFISPLSVGGGVTQTFSFSGQNFVNGVSVSVRNPQSGAVMTPAVRFISANELQVTATFPNVTSTWFWKVTNPDGRATPEFALSVIASPLITSVAPSALLTSATNQTLRFSGVNLAEIDFIEIFTPTGRSATAPIPFGVTATSFDVMIKLDSAGTWSIRATTLSRLSTPIFTFAVAKSPPTITSVSYDPAYASPSVQPFSVTGKDFDENATLTLRHVATGQVVTPVNYSRRPTVLGGDVVINTTGAWTVQATNGDGQSSAVVPFIVSTIVAPVIVSIPRTSFEVFSGPQGLPINQTGVTPLMTYRLFPPNGAPPTAPSQQWATVSGTLITLTATLDVPGTWGVQLTNPGNLSSAIATFTVIPYVEPVIAAIANVAASPAAQQLRIQGTGFDVTAAQVRLVGPQAQPVTAQIVSRSSTEIVVSHVFNTTGLWSAFVTNSNGRTSPWKTFTVTP